MPTTSVLLKPRRWPSPSSSGESPVHGRPSYRPARTVRKQQSSSRLDNPHRRPYRNSEDLAQQVYELTHPDELTFAELEREADLAPVRPVPSVSLDGRILLALAVGVSNGTA